MRKKNTELKKNPITTPWKHLQGSNDPTRDAFEWTDTRLTETDRVQIVWYCGVEVHKRNTMLACYGTLHERPILGPVENFENTEIGRKQMVTFAHQFEPRRFLMETTGIFHYTTGWTFETAFPKSQVVVMNARVIKKYLSRVRQNDRIDAINLAQLARYEELLQWSYLPAPHMAILREYVRQRSKAVAETVKTKNRIKKILDMFGCGWTLNFQVQWQCELIKAFCNGQDSWGDFLISKEVLPWHNYLIKNREEFDAWGTANPPIEAREQVLFLFQELCIQQCVLVAVETKIRSKVGQDPAIKPQLELILDMPGLGEFGALEIITEIGAINRFPNAKFLIPYAGISPSGKTSGKKTRGSTEEQIVEHDKPNPYKNPRLKRVLVATAGVICRLAKKGGNSGDSLIKYAQAQLPRDLPKMKIYFKVASKLTRSLFYCLSHKVKYNPKGEFDTNKQILQHTSRRKRETIMKQILKTQAEDAWKSVKIITDMLSKMGLNSSSVDIMIKQLKPIQSPLILSQENGLGDS